MTEFSTVNAPPTAPPRTRNTIAGRYVRSTARCYITACGRVLHSGNPLEIQAVTEAVVAGSLAVAALNAVSGVLGASVWYRGDDGGGASTDHGAAGGLVRAFWVLLRVGQGSALTLAIAVGSLAAAGRYSSEHLFYLYALLPLAVAFVAEQLRVASAQTILDQRGLQDAAAVGALPESEQQTVVVAIVRREIGVMALSALVVVFLALRAASTAHGF
jgi:hypothetical protein